MPKFRHKPTEVEAVPVRKILQAAKRGIAESPAWLQKAYDSGKIALAADYLLITTLEGQVRAKVSDWLIRGVQGELYPCSRDVFEASYEEIPEDDPGREA